MASSARIEELRKKFEENPRRYFAPLANEYRKAGEIDEAITICREYLPQQPGHMNEIESEYTGVVKEVLAQDAQPVEYGQVLYRIDPNG